MGLSNIQRSTKEWIADFRLEFWKDDGGYSFPGLVDDEGRFTLKPLESDIQVENFLWAQHAAADRKWDYVKVINCGWWVRNPARGTCVCGEEVWLDGDYGHGIDCECGRIYNGSGQELAPRSQWEDRYSEESTQPYCVEFGYIGPGDEY